MAQASVHKTQLFVPLESAVSDCLVDLQEVIDVSRFRGRSTELECLHRAIQSPSCRVFVLFGMSGIGKTTLAAKLVQEIYQSAPVGFAGIVWRSLRYAPSVESTIADLLTFVSGTNGIEASLDRSISRLLAELRLQRFLLVLDDWEGVLQNGALAGHYQPEHCGYGQLLRRFAEERHQSCLLLISRELPSDLVALTGENAPVQTLPLKGLRSPDAVELLVDKGLQAETPGLAELIQVHRGNPAALKITATTIQDLFDGNIQQFLAQTSLILGDVLQSRLEQQFERLSSSEKEILIELAIAGQGQSLNDLKTRLKLSSSELLMALESLQRRSMLDKQLAATGPQFALEPTWAKYVSQHAIAQICDEVINASPPFLVLSRHLLIAAKTSLAQRSLLKRVQDNLRSALGEQAAIAAIARLQETSISDAYVLTNFNTLLELLRSSTLPP